MLSALNIFSQFFVFIAAFWYFLQTPSFFYSIIQQSFQSVFFSKLLLKKSILTGLTIFLNFLFNFQNIPANNFGHILS